MKEINGVLKHDYKDVEFVSDEANMAAIEQAVNHNANLLMDIYWRLEKVERYIQEKQNEEI